MKTFTAVALSMPLLVFVMFFADRAFAAKQNESVLQASNGISVSGSALSITVYAQEAKLIDILNRIHSITPIDVQFSSSGVEDQRVSVNLKGVSAAQAVAALLRGTSFIETVERGTHHRWIVMKSLDQPIAVAASSPVLGESVVKQQRANPTPLTTGDNEPQREEVSAKNKSFNKLTPAATFPSLARTLDEFGKLPSPPGSSIDSNNPTATATLEAYARDRDSAMASRAATVLLDGAIQDGSLQRSALMELTGNASPKAQEAWSTLIDRISQGTDGHVAQLLAKAAWDHASRLEFSSEALPLLSKLSNHPNQLVRTIGIAAAEDANRYRTNSVNTRKR
jgi:hypothetical protein